VAAFQSANPDFERVVRDSFAAQGLMGTLGAFLVEVEPGFVAIELPASLKVGQQRGLIHGGAIGAIADTAGGYAALTLMPAGSEVVTVEYKINFVRPASGQLLRAEGRILRAGKTVTVARVDVLSRAEGSFEAIALAQATFMRVGG
jgi:uncharacterized protein (TIGR00369 family)